MRTRRPSSPFCVVSQATLIRIFIFAAVAALAAFPLLNVSSAFSPGRINEESNKGKAPAKLETMPLTFEPRVESIKSNHGAFRLPMPIPTPSPETIEIYAADCTTPKTTFVLGEAVCAKTNFVTETDRFVNWCLNCPTIDHGGAGVTDITTNSSQDFLYTPTTAGSWKAAIADPSDSSIIPAEFEVIGVPPIGTYAADCMTYKTDFALGETVCAKTVGVAVNLFFPNRIIFTDPAGFGAQTADIDTDPDTSLFTLPGTATSNVNGVVVDNRGTWQANAARSNGAVRHSALFTVHEPNNPTADLSAHMFLSAGTSGVDAGSDVSFTIVVVNRGPETAEEVELSLDPPAGSTLVSLSQGPGSPTFACDGPNCTVNPLPAGSKNVFFAIFNIASGTPGGTILQAAASVNSETTPDPNADNNSSSKEFEVSNPNNQATCVLDCPTNITTAVSATHLGQPGAFVTFSTDPIGDCGEVTSTPASGTFFAVGTTPVSSISQTGGGSCTFTVTVVDTPAPTITCPAHITVSAASGASEASVNPGTPTATTSGPGTVVGQRSDSVPAVEDENGEIIVPAQPVPLTDPYPVGLTQITWTATDSAGRTASCIQNIRVNDNNCAGDVTDPTITAPDDVTVNTGPDNNGCVVALQSQLGEAIAEDECSVTVTVSGIPAGNHFPKGTTTLTYTATDGAGNTASDTQLVIIVDDTLPRIAAPADASYVCLSEVPAASPSQATRGDVFDENGVLLPAGPPSDNCGMPVVTVSEVVSGAGSAASPRIITRTYTATDSSNNSSSAVQTITVTDPTLPTITAPNDATYQCASEVPAASASDATAADNCGAPTVTFSQSDNGGAGTTVSPLVITRTYTATDAATNSASDSQTITVIDNTAPTISCPANVTMYLPLNSTATSMAVTYAAATASDNCGAPVDVVYSQDSGTGFPMGPTTVTATATDNHGNSASCEFTVTVLYNFTGFFSPVDNLPTFNEMKAGQAVPLKFSLSGNKGLDIFAVGSPNSVQITCNTGDPINDVEETLTAGSSSLSYDASSDRYHYVWKTVSSWKNTCRQLNVVLNDGSTYSAKFKFK